MRVRSHGQRSNAVTLLILGALTTINPLSIDMYLPAFQKIAEQLHTSVSHVALSLSSYFVGNAVGQMVCGPLLDRYGRKHPIYGGLALYLLASAGCMASPSITFLVGFRFLQALGGCTAQTAATALVRDFFPGSRGARAFATLMLVLSVSPLLAPTFGGFITDSLGWRWVFAVLSAVVVLIAIAVALFLPAGREADLAVQMRPGHILASFLAIFREPQFHAYVLAGGLSFSGLFVYVAASPLLFMNLFHVSTRHYGGIFALLAVGFIGGGQLNLLLTRRFSAAQIFWTALLGQVTVGALFLTAACAGWCTLGTTVAFLWLYLSCLGLIYPNGSAIALAPFETNAGRASALMGFLQGGLAALASMLVGALDPKTLIPIVAMLSASGVLALLMFLGTRRRVVQLRGLDRPVQIAAVH